MKVTANIPDALVNDLKSLNPDVNLTEALRAAIVSYIRLNRRKRIISEIREAPLEFSVNAFEMRDLNRAQ